MVSRFLLSSVLIHQILGGKSATTTRVTNANPTITIATTTVLQDASAPIAVGSVLGSGRRVFVQTNSTTNTFRPAFVTPWDARWLAEIVLNGQSICSGVLLDPWTLITAAQCSRDIALVKVNVPAIDPAVVGQEQLSFSVQSIATHPDYDSATQGNDIAVWKLLPNFITSRRIPPPNFSFDDGSFTTVSSLAVAGRARNASTSITDPMATQIVDVLSRDQCIEKNPDLQESSMCGFLGQGVCVGDIGGPIFANVGGKITIVGIRSNGNSCVRKLPAIYTKISTSQSFISSFLG